MKFFGLSSCAIGTFSILFLSSCNFLPQPLSDAEMSLADEILGIFESAVIDNRKIEWSATSMQVSESINLITLNALYTGEQGAPKDIIISFAVTGQTTAGEDYVIAQSNITIPKGLKQGPLRIEILDDSIAENTETMRVLLTDAGLIEIGEKNECVVSILDNDGGSSSGGPVVSFLNPSSTVNEADGTLIVVLNLSQPVAQAVTVPFVVSGTAQNGSDYTLASSSITIPANLLKASATVTLINNLTAEQTENLVLTLSSQFSGATLGDQTQHSIMILDDDGTGIATCNPANKIAKVKIDPPGNAVTSNGRFLARAVIPTTDQSYPSDYSKSFSFLDSDDFSIAITDNNIVNYEPNSDFAMTVEITAWLNLKSGSGPLEYFVVGGCPSSQSGLITGGSLASSIINGTDILGLQTEDVYGNQYFASLNGPAAVTVDTRKNGSIIHSIRRSVTLTPLQSSATTYPYLLGAIAFIELHNDNIVRLDLFIHNAFDNIQASNKAIGYTFFKHVKLYVKPGFNAFAVLQRSQMNIQNSQTGQLSPTSIVFKNQTTQSFTLIRESPNSKFMGMGMGRGSLYSVLLAPTSVTGVSARDFADHRGWGGVRDGVNPTTQVPYLGWSNPKSSRLYYGHPTPIFNSTEEAAARQQFTSVNNQVSAALAQGTISSPWFENTAQMWMHHLLAEYGGMTGGTLIFANGDQALASAPAIDGLLMHRQLARAMIDKQVNFLTNELGEPSLPLNSSGQAPKDYNEDVKTVHYWKQFKWADLNQNGIFDNPDASGISQDPSFLKLSIPAQNGFLNGHHGYVYKNGLVDPKIFEIDTFGVFTSIDHQHFGRFIQSISNLVQMANEPWAKWMMDYMASNAWLANSPRPREGGDQSFTLIGKYNDTLATPYNGSAGGRETGWRMTAISQAYSLFKSGPRKSLYFEHLTMSADVMDLAQSRCPAKNGVPEFGHLQRQWWPALQINTYHDMYQAYEIGIIIGGIENLLFYGFKGVDPAREEALSKVQGRAGAHLFLSEMGWDPVVKLPYYHVAAGPASNDSKVYCQKNDPEILAYPPAFSNVTAYGFEDYNVPPAYALAYRHTGDIRFVCQVIAKSGMAAVQSKLENPNPFTSNPGNTATLRALLEQEFNWTKPAACP